MAIIQLPVKTLDEHCAKCQCLDIVKQDLYGGADVVAVEFSCSNLHLCTFIRNRIVRNEKNTKEETEQ